MELKGKKIITGALLFFTILAMLCMLWFLYAGNWLNQINTLGTELNTKRRLIEKKDENLSNRKELEEYLKAYRQQLEVTTGDPSLPANQGIIYCSGLMADRGLEQTQLNIGEWEEAPEANSLRRVFFRISCLGAYEDVLTYVEELTVSSYAYEILEMKLSSKNVPDRSQVYAELQICLYSYGQDLEKTEEQKTIERGNPFYYYENK